MLEDNRRTLLFLVREDDMILLAMKKRGFGAGLLNGVGGKLDQGESLEEAMVRECQEEIGVTPTSWEKVAELDFTFPPNSKFEHLNVHTYVADEWSGEPAETEEMRPEWHDTRHIPYSGMWDDDKYWLPLIMRGEKLRASFTFDENDKVIQHTLSPTEKLLDNDNA